MKILLIETVNFIDYPTGGILNFDRTLLPALKDDLYLAGITTEDDNTPVGIWTKKTINEIEYDYFSIEKSKRTSTKPFIPRGLEVFWYLWRNMKKILSHGQYDIIMTQSTFVLFFLTRSQLERTCYIAPGLNNPLSISRYKWARRFAGLYDKIMIPPMSKAKFILAAADIKARREFEKRSRGLIKYNDIIEFPTRYNDDYYKVVDKCVCRKELGIDDKQILFSTVGRLNWFKGWKLMIDSFSIFQKKYNDSIFILIGDGEDFEIINDYIRQKELTGRVIAIGKKAPEEIGKYLNASDCFIMGSFAEGWSTTLVEACACCVPCVVTDFSSADSMIINGINGFVVSERSEVVFASAMEKAVSLNRNNIIEYNSRYKKLAVSRLKEELYMILTSK